MVVVVATVSVATDVGIVATLFYAVVVVIVALDDIGVVSVVVVDMIYATLLFALKPILKFSALVKTAAIGPITYPLPTIISFK